MKFVMCMRDMWVVQWFCIIEVLVEMCEVVGVELGGVYMRKLAPARVSYQDDFLISYRVYMMTGPFHIPLFEGTLHVNKIHV